MQLPLEVESESQKMVKTEVELQSLLQSIEYTSSCMEEFEELVIETRLKMAELKKLFAVCHRLFRVSNFKHNTVLSGTILE